MALALGVHPAHVIGKHILWLHGREVLLVQATVGMGEAILIETSLSYLGFGVQEPTPSWGNMVASGALGLFSIHQLAASRICASAPGGDAEPVRQPRLFALISLIRAQPSTKFPPWISSRA